MCGLDQDRSFAVSELIARQVQNFHEDTMLHTLQYGHVLAINARISQ